MLRIRIKYTAFVLEIMCLLSELIFLNDKSR
jgi:hypothetical protein